MLPSTQGLPQQQPPQQQPQQQQQQNVAVNSGGMTASSVDDHDVSVARDDGDDGDAENPVPGSYDLVEMEDIEIFSGKTHSCEICGRGFKRAASLRMHMRIYEDEYRTRAALRFSCPHVGCKRNKKHDEFHPFKRMSCLRDHYIRRHQCPTILTCNKCKTEFNFSSVIDLEIRQKSCGTTFAKISSSDQNIRLQGTCTGHTVQRRRLDASDMNGVPDNPSSMSSLGNDAVGFGHSDGGNSISVNASTIGLCGGSGMELSGNGLQGLTSQGGGNLGGGGLTLSTDGNVPAPEDSRSSYSVPSTHLIAGSDAMLQGLNIHE